MGVVGLATKSVGVRLLDHAIDHGALRLTDTARNGVEQIVNRRGRQIAAATDAFCLRHPGADGRLVEELFIRDQRWRSAARGAASGLPSILPGFGTAVELGVAVADWLALFHQTIELFVALCHLRGLDITDTDARTRDVLLMSGLRAGVLKLKDGRLLFGETEVGVDGVVADEVVAEVSRSIAEEAIKKTAKQRTRVAVGRLVPFGFGVAVAATADYNGIRSAAKYGSRYLDWRATETTAVATR